MNQIEYLRREIRHLEESIKRPGTTLTARQQMARMLTAKIHAFNGLVGEKNKIDHQKELLAKNEVLAKDLFRKYTGGVVVGPS